MNAKDRKTVVLILFLFIAATAPAAAQNRMPPIPAGEMTAAQKKALDEFVAARGEPTGPWIAFLRSPDLMTRTRALSDYLRYNSSLPPRLSEFLILMTARQWSQAYVWNQHYQLAVDGGLNPEIAKAIIDRRRPEKMAEDEEILYDLCMDVQRNQTVSDAVYARAVSKFGEQGVVDAVSITGYYTLISMLVNTVRTPLPAGVAPAFPPLK